MKKYIYATILVLLTACEFKPIIDSIDKGETSFYFDISTTDNSNEMLPLSTFSDSIEYLFLETSGESALGRIIKIIKRDDFFFIQSDESIHVFDRRGLFETKIKKTGKGPGEYTMIKDFDVSMSGTKIAIQSWGKVLIFSSSGDFINEFRHDAGFINFIDDDSVLTYQSNTTGDKLNSHFFLSIMGDTIAGLSNKFKFELSGSPLGLSPDIEYLTYRYKDHLFFSEIQDDTLFRIDIKHQVVPHAIFDSKEKRLTPVARAKGVELFHSLSELSFLTKVLESTRFIYYATQFSMYLYDKHAGVNHRFKGIVNDIDGVMDLAPEYASDDNCFIAVIYPFDLKKRLEDLKGVQERNEQAKLLDDHQISVNDNQILLLIHLKE